jgi:hypothetical protein
MNETKTCKLFFFFFFLGERNKKGEKVPFLALSSPITSDTYVSVSLVTMIWLLFKTKNNDLNIQKSHANNVFHFSIFPVSPSPLFFFFFFFGKKKKILIIGIEIFFHLFKNK